MKQLVVELGDKVCDKVTGFTGIAVAKHEYLQGCVRFSVQPKADMEKGTVPESETFDEPLLGLIQKAVVSPEPPDGGPSKYEDKGRHIPERR